MKSPEDWNTFTWLLLVCTAMSSGIINAYTAYRTTHREVKYLDILFDVFTSGFTCSMVFMYLDAHDMPVGMIAAIAGICGHMATRFLFLLENFIVCKFGTMANTGLDKLELPNVDDEEGK